MLPSEMHDRLLEKISGIAAPILGVITSFQQEVEYGLRVASLVVGLLVGIISLVRINKGKSQK
jgi:hypothetical protein